MVIYQNNWYIKQIYSLRTLIYYGKKYGTVEKNYGTIVTYSLLYGIHLLEKGVDIGCVIKGTYMCLCAK